MVKLMNEFRQRLARFNRDCLVPGVDQFARVSGCLRRDDADFGQLAEQRLGGGRARLFGISNVEIAICARC
jgi:hypothetical protein